MNNTRPGQSAFAEYCELHEMARNIGAVAGNRSGDRTPGWPSTKEGM